MERVEEYIRRAKSARERATNSSRNIRREYEDIAKQWELLAAERMKMLEDRLGSRDQTNGHNQ